MSGEPAASAAGREGLPPSASPRAQPFHCPYCGLEELLPGEEADTWFCESCARVFVLRLVRVAR